MLSCLNYLWTFRPAQSTWPFGSRGMNEFIKDCQINKLFRLDMVFDFYQFKHLRFSLGFLKRVSLKNNSTFYLSSCLWMDI